ncbi:MAG: putative toxin-antitoxin system toxin component, PIN family [Rhodomicrobium sp.]
MKVKRAALDTNVLISALLSPAGKPFACLSWVLDRATLLASQDLLFELDTRLARPKFEKYVDEKRRAAFVADLSLVAVQVEISGTLKACRDPDDDKLLEIAVLGQADCIVTGDQDLLVLDPFRGLRIFTPAAFLEAIAD